LTVANLPEKHVECGLARSHALDHWTDMSRLHLVTHILIKGILVTEIVMLDYFFALALPCYLDVDDALPYPQLISILIQIEDMAFLDLFLIITVLDFDDIGRLLF